MDLYLLRHPLPDVPAGICYGVTDLALAGDVRVDAERVRGLLPAGVRVVTSPLSRARDLALALHPTPTVDDDLREIDFGEWEMMPFADMPRSALDEWAADMLAFRAPGGESVGAMADRAWASFERHRDAGDEALLLVAHHGPLRAIAGRLLSLRPDRWLTLEFDYAHLCRFTLDPERGARLRWFNR